MLAMDHGPLRATAAAHTTIPSKLGELTVVARGATLVGLYFPGHWYWPDPASFGPGREIGFDAVRDQTGSSEMDSHVSRSLDVYGP